jgi:hypothetical protein
MLHVFADCYGITGLMDLTIHKLGKALVDTELDVDRVEDVTEMLQYCYDELTPPSLKSLLVSYTACKVEILWKNSRFRDLVARQGELLMALFEVMIRRLN